MCFLLIEENDEKTVTELHVFKGITGLVEGFLYEANMSPQLSLKLQSPPSTTIGS